MAAACRGSLQLASQWNGRLEPFAAADRRHFEVKRRVTRMSAFVDERFRTFVCDANLDETLGCCVRLAKM